MGILTAYNTGQSNSKTPVILRKQGVLRSSILDGFVLTENTNLTKDEKNIKAMDAQALLRVDQREARDRLRRQNLIGKESLMSNGFKGFDASNPLTLTGQNQAQLGHASSSAWAGIKNAFTQSTPTGGGGGLSPSIGRPIAQLSQGKGLLNIKGGVK